jgi:hypothetical protein
MVRWPLLGAPGRVQKDPKEAPKTPLGHRGGRQNSAKQKPEPFDNKHREQEKDNTNTPQIRSLFTKVSRSSPSGGLFWRRRGANKTQTHAFSWCVGPPGVPKWPKTLCFKMVFKHTPVATKAFRTYPHRVSRSLGCPPATANTINLRPQSGRDLGLVVGPPGPPRRGPEKPRSPQGNAKHDGGMDLLQHCEKHCF